MGRAEPDSPAAQFALSEVLLTIEGNMPRALYLHRAEQLMPYQTLEQSMESGNLQWHYLTLTQLNCNQLMGEQVISLNILTSWKLSTARMSNPSGDAADQAQTV